jgi:hypothetical protein
VKGQVAGRIATKLGGWGFLVRQPRQEEADMIRSSSYRSHAEMARIAAQCSPEAQLRANFQLLAQDFDEIAEDLEQGRTRLRHRDLLPIDSDPR